MPPRIDNDKPHNLMQENITMRSLFLFPCIDNGKNSIPYAIPVNWRFIASSISVPAARWAPSSCLPRSGRAAPPSRRPWSAMDEYYEQCEIIGGSTKTSQSRRISQTRMCLALGSCSKFILEFAYCRDTVKMSQAQSACGQTMSDMRGFSDRLELGAIL